MEMPARLTLKKFRFGLDALVELSVCENTVAVQPSRHASTSVLVKEFMCVSFGFIRIS
jgi:hypothetical protein